MGFAWGKGKSNIADLFKSFMRALSVFKSATSYNIKIKKAQVVIPALLAILKIKRKLLYCFTSLSVLVVFVSIFITTTV